MAKTISFELSKRLDKLGLLRDVETKYYITDYGEIYYANEIDVINTNDINSAMYGEGKSYWKFSDKIHQPCLTANKHYDLIFKTLTTDEAIEFLPDCIKITKHNNCKEKYLIDYNTDDYNEDFSGKTLLEAIEKMITYLLDNNLIGETKLN